MMKMKLLATSLATLLSLSAAAQDKVEQQLDIRIVGDEVTLDATENEQVYTVKLDASRLDDEDYLQQSLAEVPEGLRVNIVSSLQGIHGVKGHTMTWVSGGDDEQVHEQKNVFVIKTDKQDGEDMQFTTSKNVVIKMDHGKGSVDVIKTLIEKGQFSRDELAELQAALDAKH